MATPVTPSSQIHRQARPLLPILLMFALLGGCTHKRLMETGNNQLQQQRYELAVGTYERALREKPDDSRTRQQLEQAQVGLEQWTAGIYRAAKVAEQQNHSARAMLLFGKVAELNRDSYALLRYNELRQQLAEQARYKAHIRYSKEIFGDQFTRELTDLVWLPKADPAINNQFSLNLALSNPVFEMTTSTKEVKQQYVTGYERIANPELIEAQQQATALREDMADVSHQMDDEQHGLQQLDHQLNRLARQQQQLENRLHQTSPSSQLAATLQYQLGGLNEQYKQLDKKHHKSQKRVNKYQHHYDEYQQELHEVVTELAHLPAIVEVPVYADYHYQVQQQTNSLSASLLLKGAGNSSLSQGVSVDVTDESHEAHPVIELDIDPMHLPGEQQLLPQLHQQAAEQAKRLVNRAIDQYRQELLIEARQTVSEQQRFELWVKHGLVRARGADHDAITAIRHALELQHGLGGEFRVNELLHLYQVH